MYNEVKSRRQFCDTFLDTLLKIPIIPNSRRPNSIAV